MFVKNMLSWICIILKDMISLLQLDPNIPYTIPMSSLDNCRYNEIDDTKIIRTKPNNNLSTEKYV
jgi:hypothetical protein